MRITHELGEWDDEHNFFWFGANNNEYIANRYADHITVYPCDDPKHRPSAIIEGTERITDLQSFTNVLENGTTLLIDYSPAKEAPAGILPAMDPDTALTNYKKGDHTLAVKNAILQDAYAVLEDENFHTAIAVIESLTGLKYT